MRTHISDETDYLWAENYYWLGLISLDLKRYDAAKQAFSKAIELNPFHSDCLYWRGVLLSGEGNHRAAESDYIDSICLEPACADTYLRLTISQNALGKRDAAFQNFARHIAHIAPKQQ
jgi:tetratricopeptide (TPR) repeat protein